jgi:hypothetical protein
MARVIRVPTAQGIETLFALRRDEEETALLAWAAIRETAPRGTMQRLDRLFASPVLEQGKALSSRALDVLNESLGGARLPPLSFRECAGDRYSAERGPAKARARVEFLDGIASREAARAAYLAASPHPGAPPEPQAPPPLPPAPSEPAPEAAAGEWAEITPDGFLVTVGEALLLAASQLDRYGRVPFGPENSEAAAALADRGAIEVRGYLRRRTLGPSEVRMHGGARQRETVEASQAWFLTVAGKSLVPEALRLLDPAARERDVAAAREAGEREAAEAREQRDRALAVAEDATARLADRQGLAEEAATRATRAVMTALATGGSALAVLGAAAAAGSKPGRG